MAPLPTECSTIREALLPEYSGVPGVITRLPSFCAWYGWRYSSATSVIQLSLVSCNPAIAPGSVRMPQPDESKPEVSESEKALPSTPNHASTSAINPRWNGPTGTAQVAPAPSWLYTKMLVARASRVNPEPRPRRKLAVNIGATCQTPPTAHRCCPS